MEPLITPYHAGLRELVLSPRYHHDLSKARRPKVIVQWTRSGYGLYEDKEGLRPVPPDYAFVTIVPTAAQYYYPKEGQEPWMIDWVDFVGPLALSLFANFSEQFGPVIPLRRKGAAAAHFHRLITSVLTESPRDRWAESQRAYAFLLEWWREAMLADAEPQIIETVLSLCETAAYRLMTVKELAAECGMSREHFTRRFTQQVGIPPAEWLRERRLAAAAKLLREDATLPLAMVARETGFANGRQLMAAFRRAYGQTTEEYRQTAAHSQVNQGNPKRP